MSDRHKWTVPTTGEIAAGHRATETRGRGPLAWVRKLRLRSQVGERREIAKPPVLPSPLSASATAASLDRGTDLKPGIRSSRRTPVSQEPAPPVGTAEAPTPPPTYEEIEGVLRSEVGRRPIRRARISDGALRRRAGSNPNFGASPRGAAPRSLSMGLGWGRCSCGQEFRGPRDVVEATFAAHRCGTNRGTDRPDPVFDR